MPQIKGIIRDDSDVLQVLKTETGEVHICYYDSYSDTYCIDQVDNHWRARSEISADGWRFVNGYTTLYDGVEPKEVMQDTDPID